jgi:hypothetical protein
MNSLRIRKKPQPVSVVHGIKEAMKKFDISAYVVIVGGCLCLTQAAAVAQANWSYNPFTGSATWLGAANMLMYPINRYSSASAPLYMADPLIWGGAYYVNRSLTNSGRQFNYGNYTPDDGSTYQRPRTRPVVADGNGAVDQIVHATPRGGVVPPPAPNFSRLPQYPQPSMAQGFVSLVNSKYGGNISKALFDPQTRSYARSVGLIASDEIFDADLSPQKVDTIKNIFADEQEDPAARINAARLLLKH